MSNIIYLLGILLVGGSAIFSFLLSEKHKSITQNTYEEQVKIDDLKHKIRIARGEDYDPAEIADTDDIVGKKTAEQMYRLIYSRMLSGRPKEIVMDLDADGVTQMIYNREIEDKNYKFVPLHNAEGDELAYLETEALDIVVGKAKQDASADIDSAIASRLSSLKSRNDELTGNIKRKTTERDGLKADIAKFVESERKIKEEFGKHGVEDLKGANELLTKLEEEQKVKISERQALEQEKQAFTDKKTNNTEKLGELAEYREERRLSLGANSKTFPLATVDFDWGFVVIEPGRIMANVDYKTFRNGDRIKSGDVAILKEPADQ